ncbi:HNH endonuclease [Pseudomonas aeruginosa]|nr:HNH endonuclease [Pseudomonas aeruginosa]EKV3092742.1 HNH endonuclease [Pseudomonas aeruginosa]
MKRLVPPPFDAAGVVQTCASGITIAERSQALLEALPVIQSSEAEYRELGPVGQLYRIAESDVVTPAIDANLMGVIYKSHFVRKGSPSRPLYEQIKMAPEFGICPLCGQRVVATVDHYLPQSRYPRLNLTPVNLVPACADCNKQKLAGVPTRAEDQTLHPYFDDLGNERWLIVEVMPTSPPTITFAIRPSSNWTEVLSTRVRHHFHVMGLGELYVAQAASEMADISYALEDIGTNVGPDGVRQHLDGQFRSRHARDANSWKTALYEGLRDSDWFCAEGYRLIRNRPN